MGYLGFSLKDDTSLSVWSLTSPGLLITWREGMFSSDCHCRLIVTAGHANVGKTFIDTSVWVTILSICSRFSKEQRCGVCPPGAEV